MGSGERAGKRTSFKCAGAHESILSERQPRIALIVLLKPLQRAVANFFVDRQIVVSRRTEGIEHTRGQQRFYAVRNIAREIKGIAG